MTPQQIAIYGGGGFGREVAWLIESHNRLDDKYQITCFIDDDPLIQGKLINNIPAMGLDMAWRHFPSAKVVSGIRTPKTRQLTMERTASRGFDTEIIIHPGVERSPWVKIDKGTLICAGCILTTNIIIGKHVQINLDCTVGHDVVLGDFTTLSTGVHIPGFVHIGERVSVGTGAVFLNGKADDPLRIGDDVEIGARAYVTRSIPSGIWEGSQPPNPKSLEQDNRFRDWVFPKIEESTLTKYNWLVQNVHNLHVGYKTDIGAFTYINAKYGVTIKDFVQIGSHCSIYSISTIDNKKGPVTLKQNCRIGSHSIIMPGVTIGENSVIGACSYVNIDIPENVIAVGVPAKIVKAID